MRAVIYGSRPDGHARVVAELFAGSGEIEFAGLLDDYPDNAEHRFAGLSVIGTGDDLASLRGGGVEAAVLGFGAGRGRSAIVDRILTAGLQLPTLVHPAATVAAGARIDIGCQVLPGAVISPGASLGRGVLVNCGAIVEHDSVLGDGVVVYSGAVIAGRVTVGAESELGAGATVVPDIRIGSGSRVGAGASVVEDVADGVTVVGVPARPVART